MSAVLDTRSNEIADGALTVMLSESEVKQRASTEQASIAADETLDDGDSLKILVEKVFACLTACDGEDESNMFPHPLEGQD